MINTNLKNVNMMSKKQYNEVEEPSKNELWVIEIETYKDDDGNWYRVYPDGWCIQGGNFGTAFSSWSARTVNFLKPFKDTSYYVNAIVGHTSQTDSPCINLKTTTSFSCTIYNSTGNACWEAKGYIA